MRTLALLTALLTLCVGAIAPVRATTLEQLSLPAMAQQSTAIVRARVLSANARLRGGDVYTVYEVQTIESLKAVSRRSSQVPVREVAVPGGVAGGIRQVMAGAPALRVGAEYVMFLWTSHSGLTQIMGLSQGLFSVQPDAAKKDALVTRGAAGEHMLDVSGRPVHDQALVMPWTELKAQVNQALHTHPLAVNAAAGSR